MTKDERRSARSIVLEWARMIHPDETGKGGDRAARARLRRAPSVMTVLADPATVELAHRLGEADGAGFDTDRLRRGVDTARLRNVAIIAAVIAALPRLPHRDEEPTFATALGQTSGNDRPALSPLRFARLVSALDPEERLRLLRRAVAQLDRRPFDLGRFADDLLFWGDAARTRWIFQYHQEAAATPRTTEEPTS